MRSILLVDKQPKERMADFCNASDVCSAVLRKAENFKTVYLNKLFDYTACARPSIVAIDGVARKLVEDAGGGFTFLRKILSSWPPRCSTCVTTLRLPSPWVLRAALRNWDMLGERGGDRLVAQGRSKGILGAGDSSDAIADAGLTERSRRSPPTPLATETGGSAGSEACSSERSPAP